MRDDGDFSSYLVARWPGLIRTLVLLGCSYAQAESVAVDALARCRPSWKRHRGADVDVHVHRAVLEQLGRLRRTGRIADVPETPEPPLVLDPTLADPDQRLALRHALETALGDVPDDERVVLVLRFVAGLGEVQVADVLDLAVAEVRERQGGGLSRLDLVALQEGR